MKLGVSFREHMLKIWVTDLWWAVLCELRRLPKWDDPEDKIWFADVVFGKVKAVHEVVDGGLVDDDVDLDVGGGIPKLIIILIIKINN